MLAGMVSLSALAEESEAIEVSIRIEGLKETLYYDSNMKLAPGATVLDLLELLNDADDAPAIVITDSTYGAYISEIGGLAEFDYGPMSGWSYRVNDEDPAFGISMYKLENNDSVVYYYGDPFGIGMQHPVTGLSRILSEGIITFTSLDTEYDENWNATVAEKPVKDATVTFNGLTYTTNEKGEIKLENKTGLSGFRTLQIERYDESGVPTVLRFKPGHEVFVPFADTPAGDWYMNAIKFCVREWNYTGTDLNANLFEPMRTMTMAQLVEVLMRVAGAGEGNVTDPWYAAALEWAVANEVIAEDEFIEDSKVTKEKFIYMFYLTVALSGDYDMTVRADITGAVDYEDINAAYLEAISWAVASEIVEGTSETELVVDPFAEFTRAMVCQLLYKYLG